MYLDLSFNEHITVFCIIAKCVTFKGVAKVVSLHGRVEQRASSRCLRSSYISLPLLSPPLDLVHQDGREPKAKLGLDHKSAKETN